ncbi:MAG: RHS repeat protein, partial [Myxococcaceae bacterium]|nr:RHS repeat protein [Myxococcaceae bacterium]
MMSGSLEVAHADLSFSGPVRPLEFRRLYSSQGNDRSELGSNWTHNWDVRLIPLRQENLPPGIDPYCEGTPEDVTCVYLRAGHSSTLYMRDGRDFLFKPQAGSFATILKVDTGWLLRGHDGHVQRFDADGYLTHDVDRFGNGFELEYELNAWGRLDKALCPNAILRFNPTNGTWADAIGPTGQYAASSLTCGLLAGLVGRTKPLLKSTTTPFDATRDAILPANPSAELQNARALLIASQQGGVGNASVWGQRIKRVSRVRELSDTTNGRSLVFSYWPDTDTTVVAGSTVIRRAGLLREVSGPAGGTVSFSYEAAPVPDRLFEVMLKTVNRTDSGTMPAGVVAGPARSYTFTYAGAALTQVQLDDLYRRYRGYFSATTNCTFVTFDPCGNPLVPLFQRMTDEEIDRRVDALRSDVADNILRIDAPNEIVETQYDTSPMSRTFDRVTAQRWGSSSVTPSPGGPPWTTTLPQANFAYIDEGPDGSDFFLEPEIAGRYGYEAVPASNVADSQFMGLLLPPDSTGTPQGPAGMMTGGTQVGGTLPNGQNVKPCTPGNEKNLRTTLPGYRRSYTYYPLDLAPEPPSGPLTDGLHTAGVDLDMTLRRSRLSCTQLAEAQMWDAEHNDLTTRFVAYDAATKKFTPRSFIGRRPEMNLNANRICAWTRYTDRVGSVHVYGYNYHGRPLVAATKVGSTWRFAETLYNADGNVISQRRVLPQGTPWAFAQGDTRYGYVEGKLVGTNFQEPAPWYWAQRANMRTILERPRGGSVTDEVPGSVTPETTVGRFTSLTYEPLFSQVSRVESGSVTSTQRRTHRTTEVLYDYQECKTTDCLPNTDNHLGLLLVDAQRWGAQFPTQPDGSLDLTNNPLSGIVGYGDLNGDGQVGFPARGTVVQVRSSGGGATAEVSVYRFSPHGKPHFIQSPDLTVTAIDYLPFSDLTGVGHGNQRGYLSRVRVMRDRSKSAANGPLTAPCPNLPGPYRWLLPANCSSGGLVNELKTLAGLSDGVAQEIVRQAITADVASTVRFQYSVLGQPSTVFEADGSEVRITRDVDGRVREEQLFESATQLHSRTVSTRNSQGLPTRIERFSRSGASLGATVQTWDEEGNLRSRCTEAIAGGCNGIAHGALPPGNPLGGTSETFWYDREGRLIREMDAEGAYTEYHLDARGWVSGISNTAAGESGRHTALTLNDDGQWTSRARHQLTTLSPLAIGAAVTSESRTLDGFGRVRSVMDSEGRVSTVNFTARDGLSSVSTASGAWLVRYLRDDFNRVTERTVNGQTTMQVERAPGGRIWRRKAIGAEPTFITYDEFGSPVFERQGTVTTVRVSPPDRRYRGGAVVRSEARRATNSTEQTLDVLGEVIAEVETGFDGTSTPPTRTSSFVRDDSGFLRQATDSLGAVSEYVPNFLGWSGTEIVTVNPGVMRTTSFTYNRRGQLVARTDPRGGAQTVQSYTGYGEPKTRTVPGGPTGAPSDVTATWTYDAVGRLTRETMGTAALRYEYANDRLWRVLADDGTTQLRSFTYDALGRISSATHQNVGLSAWVAATQRPVVATRTYDSLGRLATETTKVG